MSQQGNKQSGGLKGMYANLTEREQTLLKAMLGVFVVLAIFIVIALARGAVADLEEETMQYQAALSLLATQGPAFAAAQQGSAGEAQTRADLFTEEILSDNPVQLTSYVASHASAVSVSVSSYDVDESPLGSARDDGPLIEEQQLRADIRDAEMDSFIELLHRIEESRDPVVIKRLDVRSVRDEGKVRALLIVSTYRYARTEDS